MEPALRKQKTSHLQQPDGSSSSSGICTVVTGSQENHMEDFIPRCYVRITSTIFKYLTANDILKLSKVSRMWFTPCRNYLRSNQKDDQCLLVLDKVGGLDALQRLIQVLDDKILGLNHPFTGVHFQFSDPFDDFFKTGTGPNKRPPPVVPEDPQDFPMFEDYGVDYDSDYDDTNHDYAQDYDSFDAWMFTQNEKALERRKEQAKLDVPLKRIFAKIPSIKHVHIVVDYGTKRSFEGNKFKRFFSLLPLNQIEYFRTNLRISEFSSDLRQGEMLNLKKIQIDGLMNALPSTLNQFLGACPALECWDSPIPGHMVASFGTKRHLIKNLIMYNFVKAPHFNEIRRANLSLTSLIANSSSCAIGKGSYDDIVGIIRDNSTSLQTIQMSDAFLKHLLKSNLTPIDSVRKIIIGKCGKANKTKALEIFPNAIFVSKVLLD